MTRDPWQNMQNPYDNEEFKEFIAPQVDRKQWICDYLCTHKISFSIIETGMQKHILVEFDKKFYNARFRTKTILAHYDRIGIGANDNSSSVYQILKWCENLNQSKTEHNIRIIFTDGEEIGVGKSKQNLGVMGIAIFFKKNGFINDDIYAIDSCGRGDTLIISSNKEKNENLHFQKAFDSFHERTIRLAQFACANNWATCPLPYGDNAGFILLGLPAIEISVLPREECNNYKRKILINPDFFKKLSGKNPSEKKNADVPPTWKMMHTQADTIENLTSESWPLMQSFFKTLEKMQTPL